MVNFNWMIMGVIGIIPAMFLALNLRDQIVSTDERWFAVVAGMFLLALALSVAQKLCSSNDKKEKVNELEPDVKILPDDPKIQILQTASSSASSSMVPSTSASSSRSCKYDVFLSFRGGDVRGTFIDHLYFSLEYHLIATFKDDVKLPRGEPIRQSLFEAIEDSYIAVVVFSKNYADSSWCLDELAHVMKCKEERGLIVIPIFYDVDPSDVRKQKNDFGAAFATQEAQNSNKAQTWRNALVEASNNSGLEPKYVANGLETKVIKEIIDTLLVRLPHLKTNSKTSVDEDFVGMTTRVHELKALLNIGSDGVCMVGIWGIGGGGKTTLANSLCREVAKDFHGVCTIENVTEETSRCGLKKLQENILFSLFKTNVNVQSVTQGMDMIKGMACRRKVLLVLDDVSHLDQLEALAGKPDWFGSGSRIIITTRDEKLLRTHKVNEVHEVKLLSDNEALKLFNRYAYNEDAPVEDYKHLSLLAVSKADGLPLALKFFGLFLHDRTKDEWMETLERLNEIPKLEVVKKLKVTYDGLDHDVQELFLDLACFFRRRWEVHIMDILKACGYRHQTGLKVLREKAYITTKHGFIDMHDMVQEMGHYIVRRKKPDNPEKHSRVWKNQEIESMCFGDATRKNYKIKAIQYQHCELENMPSQFCTFISSLKKLRYLNVHMKNGLNVQGPCFLSNELRYIEWHGYPGPSSFPDSFQPMNLGFLRLEESMQTHLWYGSKVVPCLKMLKLVKMHALESTPDFNGLPCLRELEIDECKELEEIHSSLGNHTCLEKVWIFRCDKLKMFPTIVNMKKLKTLLILGCRKILEFPMIHANMESLESLSLCETDIEVLPSSIERRCPNLHDLTLFSLPNLKSIQFNINAFQHLKKLILDVSCRFTDEEIPHGVSNALLSNLQELSLVGCTLSRLDFSIAQHTELKKLDLSNCKNLVELPELPSSLNVLVADRCLSLVTLGDCYKNCARLCYVSLQGGRIISDGDNLIDFMLQACMSNENHSVILKIKGVMEQATKGVHDGRYFRPNLELPENWHDGFSGFLLSVIFKTNYYVVDVHIEVKEFMSGRDSEYYDWLLKESDDDDDDDDMDYEDDLREWTWLGYVSFGSLRDTKWWNSTHKTILFYIHGFGLDPADNRQFLLCSTGFHVELVERRSGTSLEYETSTSSSQYAPELCVIDDSESALTISLRNYYYHEF